MKINKNIILNHLLIIFINCDNVMKYSYKLMLNFKNI